MHLQHCWAVLHCLWRDTCNHSRTCPRHPAHRQSHLQELWQGYSPLASIHTEMLKKVWHSLRDGVKTNVVTLSVVMTGLKLAFAAAHTTTSRGRRWDAEQSVLSVEQGTRPLLVYTPLFPCTLPPGLVLWRSENLTQHRQKADLWQPGEGMQIVPVGTPGCTCVCQSLGNHTTAVAGKDRDRQRHTCKMLSRGKEFPRTLWSQILPKEVRSEELCPAAEHLLHLKSCFSPFPLGKRNCRR